MAARIIDPIIENAMLPSEATQVSVIAMRSCAREVAMATFLALRLAPTIAFDVGEIAILNEGQQPQNSEIDRHATSKIPIKAVGGKDNYKVLPLAVTLRKKKSIAFSKCDLSLSVDEDMMKRLFNQADIQSSGSISFSALQSFLSYHGHPHLAKANNIKSTMQELCIDFVKPMQFNQFCYYISCILKANPAIEFPVFPLLPSEVESMKFDQSVCCQETIPLQDEISCIESYSSTNDDSLILRSPNREKVIKSHQKLKKLHRETSRHERVHPIINILDKGDVHSSEPKTGRQSKSTNIKMRSKSAESKQVGFRPFSPSPKQSLRMKKEPSYNITKAYFALLLLT